MPVNTPKHSLSQKWKPVIFARMAKFEHDTVVPVQGSAMSKKEQVADMFDNIAFRYDFLNRFFECRH